MAISGVHMQGSKCFSSRTAYDRYKLFVPSSISPTPMMPPAPQCAVQYPAQRGVGARYLLSHCSPVSIPSSMCGSENLLFKLQPALRVELCENILPLPVELQDLLVVFPQASPVRHCHERDSQPLCLVVHDTLNLQSDRACALVENRVSRSVVE
jgi:hypothetical protein